MSTSTIPQSLTPERIDALAEYLDSLDDTRRVRFVRSIGARTQARLWEAARKRPATLDDLVPPSSAPGVEVIHKGKNTLPVLSSFEKRFCRAAERDDLLYGYNEGPTREIVGPGYFVVPAAAAEIEIGVDYRKVPPPSARLPLAWPQVKTNEVGLQRLVFAGMVDHMRRISHHVTIGRATRGGKTTNNYFLLCRLDG